MKCFLTLPLSMMLAATAWIEAPAATNLPAYYAHPAVVDEYGVIAPWYQGLNGQCDLRVGQLERAAFGRGPEG